MYFLIQSCVFGEEENLLCNAIRNAKTEDNSPLFYNVVDTDYIPKTNKNIVPRGTIDFIEKIEKHTKEKYITLDNYTCSNYYSYYKELLLNYDYIILPWAELEYKKEIIFKCFDTDELFIRPNSGRKIFTGTSLTKKWWDKELKVIANLPSSNIKSTDLVLISSYKNIGDEYRVLLHNDKVIDFTCYTENLENLKIQNILDAFVIPYWPDKYWTMDLCVYNNWPRIIEINSFNSAGLYNMDYDKIIKYLLKNR